MHILLPYNYILSQMYDFIWNCHNIVLSLQDMPRSLPHKEYKELPAGAIKVSDYAKAKPCSTSLLYHQLKRGKADFTIIVWQGINFVLPNN